MNIVSVEAGRVTQIFVADEVRAERDIYVPQLIDLVQKRYGFTTLPTLSETKTGGAKFGHGVLGTEKGSITIEALEIYNDGIVASCRNTVDADTVLSDAIAWGTQAFGLRAPKTFLPRTYGSFVVADFKASTSALFGRFAEMQELMSAAYEHRYKVKRNYETSKLSIAVDPTTVPQFTNTEFLFDRRSGAPYSLNRFFCVAPLPTPEHIAFLEKFEGLFGTT